MATAKQRAWRREFARRYGKKKRTRPARSRPARRPRSRPARKQPSRRVGKPQRPTPERVVYIRAPSRPTVKRAAPKKTFTSDVRKVYRFAKPRAKKTYQWAAPRAKSTAVRSGRFLGQQGKRMASATRSFFQRRREARAQRERMVWKSE